MSTGSRGTARGGSLPAAPMIFDIALVAFLLMSLALGHFLGVWRHLGVVLAMAVGYGLTPLWVPQAIPRLTGYTTWPPLFSAVACVAG